MMVSLYIVTSLSMQATVIEICIEKEWKWEGGRGYRNLRGCIHICEDLTK